MHLMYVWKNFSPLLHSAIIHICLVFQIIFIFSFQYMSQNIIGRITPRVTFVAVSLLPFAMFTILVLFSAVLIAVIKLLYQ
jgi:hypothetical protein